MSSALSDLTLVLCVDYPKFALDLFLNTKQRRLKITQTGFNVSYDMMPRPYGGKFCIKYIDTCILQHSTASSVVNVLISIKDVSAVLKRSSLERVAVSA